MKAMIGTVIFWLGWPVLWFIFPLTRRVRVIVVDGDKFLCVKHTIGPGHWDLPGGGMQFSEAIEQAAERELHEELGITIQNPRVLNTELTFHRAFGLLFRLHYVYAQIHPDFDLKKNWEICSVKWRPLDELQSMVPRHIQVT